MTWRFFTGFGLIGLGTVFQFYDYLDKYTQVELVITSFLCLAVGVSYAPTKGEYE